MIRSLYISDRHVQGPSLLKKTLGGQTFIVCVSMTSPCSLNRCTLWNLHILVTMACHGYTQHFALRLLWKH